VAQWWRRRCTAIVAVDNVGQSQSQRRRTKHGSQSTGVAADHASQLVSTSADQQLEFVILINGWSSCVFGNIFRY
jgi:hypothetical protein